MAAGGGNTPLIGGRLEIEGAAAFARNMKMIERSMKSLNDSMHIIAAEGLNRRLGAVAKSFDVMALGAGRAAKSMAAVNAQVSALGRRTATIQKLAASIAALNIAGAQGGGGAGGNRGVSNAALLASILSRPAGGGGGGAGGAASALSSPIKMTAAEAAIRRLNAAKMTMDISSAKQEIALAARTAAQKKAIYDKQQAAYARSIEQMYRREEIAAGRAARNIVRTRAVAARQMAAVMSGGGGRSGGASRPTDFIPGLGLGSTAYFRGNVGPAAIYTRLPLSLGAVGAAAGIATIAMTALGAQFQKTANSAKVFADLSEGRLKAVSKASIELSRDFTTSADKVLQGAVSLGKAGAPVADLGNNVLKTATLMAEASQGEITVADAGKILVQTINAQGLSWKEAAKIADAYTGVIQNTVMTFDDLDQGMTQLLPVGSALGFTYKELIVAQGVLQQSGLSAAVATTALKNTMLRMLHPTEESREILEKYKISLFDVNGKIKPLINLFKELTTAFGSNADGASDAQRFFDLADLGSARTILALSTISKQGPEAFQRLWDKANVSTEGIALALQKNVIKQLELSINQVSALGIAMSTNLVGGLTLVAAAANKSLRGVALNSAEAFGDSVTNLGIKLAKALAPGVVALAGSLGRVFGAAVTPGNQLTVTLEKIAKASSNVLIGASVAIDRIREFLSRPLTRDGKKMDLFNTTDLEKSIALNQDRILRFVAFLKTAKDYIGQILSQAPDMKNWDEMFADNYNSLRLSMGLIEHGSDKVIKLINTDIAKLGLSTTAMVDGLVLGIDNATGKLVGGVDVNIAKLGSGVLAAGATLSQTIDMTTGKMVDSLIITLDRATTGIAGFMEENAIRFAANAEWAASIIRGAIGAVQNAFVPNQLSVEEEIAILNAGGARSVFPREAGPGVMNPPAGGGGGGDKEPNLDDITKQVRELLVSVPGLTEDLFRFIAGLAQDVPARLMPMVNAIKGSREQVRQLLIAKQGLLSIDMQLFESSQREAGLQAQMGQIEIQQAIAVIGYDRQLLGLRQELLEIDARMQPLQDRLVDIDREAAKLQQENLVLSRQRIGLEIQMLPIRGQIEDIDRAITELARVDFNLARERLGIELSMLEPRRAIAAIDRQISDLQRKNFTAERERLQGEISALPIRNQIRDIEEQITATIDRRAGVAKSLRELDLADATDDLADAWERMDIPAILRLEEQKAAIEETLKGDAKAERAAERRRLGLELEKIGLEESLDPITKRLQKLADTAAAQGLLNELTILGLEEQKQPLDDLILRLQDKLDKLAFEEEKRRILNEITAVGLEAEKQKLLDILGPMERKLEAIARETEADRLRSDLALTFLEEERRRIQALLQPMEDQRKAIERNMQQIDLLRARAVLEFEERKIQIQAMILDEQLRQSELEATRKEQEILFLALVTGFLDSMEASGAFSAEEAVEVAKRGKLWDKSVEDIVEMRTEFNRVQEAANQYHKELDAIPRKIDIEIVTTHRDVYASSPGGTTPNPADAGSEGAVTTSGQRAASMSNGASVTNITNSYSVDANYANTQSPAAIKDDMRALIMMAGRG